MTTERSTFKTYSVVLTSFSYEITIMSYFRAHRTISLYSYSRSVWPYNLGPQVKCLAIPRTNAIEISSRSGIQAPLDKPSPDIISWQTRLSGKDQKPQLLRKGRQVKAIRLSYEASISLLDIRLMTSVLLDVCHSAWNTDAFSTAAVLLWSQTPWRFLLGKDFHPGPKESLNILTLHKSCPTLVYAFALYLQRYGNEQAW